VIAEMGLKSAEPRYRCFLTTAAFATVVCVILLANGSARACGGIFDVTCNVGNAISGTIRDAGPVVLQVKEIPQAALQEARPENIQAVKEVYHYLSTTKTLDDLFSLNAMTNPCSVIDCHGIGAESTLRLISSVLLQKQSQSDALLKQQQAWAAIASSSIALLSLVVSAASFVRAGRTGRRT
jgi:hypothetical protein